jgi:hypothetical protein
VKSTTMFAQRLHQLGGFQGLDQLVSDSKSLLIEKHALAKLRRCVDGPNGLGAKASKYSRLQHAFAMIEGDSGGNSVQTNVPAAVSSGNKKNKKHKKQQ